MEQYGILVDNEYCTGCHACEIACKNEKGLGKGQWGIKVLQLGPWELPDGEHWEFRYTPMLSANCDLCAERVLHGESPSCCFHCPADSLTYGLLDELAILMAEKGKMATIVIP